MRIGKDHDKKNQAFWQQRQLRNKKTIIKSSAKLLTAGLFCYMTMKFKISSFYIYIDKIKDNLRGQ